MKIDDILELENMINLLLCLQIGKEQHYELGQYLRRRYNGLLNQTDYSKDTVYVRSTDVDRTLMSALSNLAGLFPPSPDEIWHPQLPWQPIPVHTLPERMDHVLSAKRTCPMYDFTLKKYKTSAEYRAMLKRYKPLFQYLTKHTGKHIDSFTAVQNLYNTLWIEDLYNLTLPEWTKPVYPDGDMKWIATRSFATATNTKTLARLKTGFLLSEILDRFRNKTMGELLPNRSMWVYSAHDTTIANVLNTLGMFELHSPPYRACIMIELRLINDVPYIQIFYKNTTNENPPAMHIPNCGQLCPLENMYKLYEDVLPTNDFVTECRISMLMMTYEEADFGGTETGMFMSNRKMYK